MLWGFANAVALTLALNFSRFVILWGFASCWKVRLREFTSPLVARCAMGFCKRGCADARVEFFSVRYSMGVCKRLESEVARIYVATCCSLCYGVLQTRLCRRLRVFFLGSLFYGGLRAFGK